jgi:hypothetical protein
MELGDLTLVSKTKWPAISHSDGVCNTSSVFPRFIEFTQLYTENYSKESIAFNPCIETIPFNAPVLDTFTIKKIYPVAQSYLYGYQQVFMTPSLSSV